LLTRATARQRELSIRAALGASQWDIIQQLLVESLMLAVAGGIVGLLISLWMVDGIVTLLPNDIPRLSGLLPDWRVLLFTTSAALVTGLLCGLLPALSVSRQNLANAIKDGGRSTTDGLARGKLRNTLGVAEIAVAFTLLVGAGLLFKSLYRLNQVNPGFSTANILTAQFGLGGARYLGQGFRPEAINQFLAQLQERIERLPGVRAVTYAQCVPFTGNENNTRFDLIERPAPPDAKPAAQLRFISPGYFETLQIPLKAGRAFTPRDDPQAPNVMLVNEAFVREYLRDETVIGRHLKLGWGGDAPKEIVGVVGDVRHRGLGDDVRPEMYVPQAQFPNTDITLAVRTQNDPLMLSNMVKKEVRALDPALAVTDIKTLNQFRRETLATPRFNSFLLGGFALLALLLTLVGLYGVMSYSVTQRTPEIGIRMALGASAADVLRMIVAQGARLIAVGLALGLVGACALTRVLQNLLYDVRPTDPLTFALTALLLATVTLLACYWPARRATQVDP
jgi:putative ABC transport system permease protein